MTIKIEVTAEELAGVVISAVEGGIGYWASVRNYAPNDGTVEVLDRDEPRDTRKWRKVTPTAIAKGLAVCAEKYPHVFGAWARDRIGDATTADVIVQCAIFGEAVYG